MKRHIIISVLLLFALCAMAQKSFKAPKPVQKASQCMATVLAYKSCVLHANGTAFFTGENGNLVSSASLFVGVDSAVIIDAAGIVRPVKSIVGYNEMFDCVKVRVEWDKKIKSLPLSNGAVSAGDELYMLSYGGKKGGAVTPLAIASVDSVYSNAYYTFDVPMEKGSIGLPLLDANGAVVAFMQPAAAMDTVRSYAVGSTLFTSLDATVATFGKGIYPGMAIRTALPLEKENALPCLYMQSMMGDSISYGTVVNEFISSFPEAYEGYMAKGEYSAVYLRDMSVAEEAWKAAIERADSVSEVHFSRAKTIFSIVQSGDSVSHPLLSYANAFDAVEAAIDNSPQPIYVNYKADMLFACQRYAEAAKCYESLTSTNLRSPGIFAKASQCYSSVEDYGNAIALLDSAVNCYGDIGKNSSAPYILTRALVKMSAKRYREAVLDYNSYEEIVGGGLNASFYYMREQAEVKGRMFQQALNDIETAIYLDPENPSYYIEKCVLCYRVKMTDEGLRAMVKAKELVPEAPDVYYLLGCLYSQKNSKADARANLEKALSLGHPGAQAKLDELK